jgi:hypothetical protein
VTRNPTIAVENSLINDARRRADRQNVFPDVPSKNARLGLTERFYSGQRDGQVTFRDGIGGGKKHPLEPRFVLLKQELQKTTRPNDGSKLALTLLADALGDEARAIEIHKYFSRRVVALFPERWTITRSRVRSYVDLIEREKLANLAAED